jgi:hypothetical protein
METLAELQQLRRQLAQCMAKLMDEAESHPTSIAALKCTELACDCRRLDRAAELLAVDILKSFPAAGAA